MKANGEQSMQRTDGPNTRSKNKLVVEVHAGGQGRGNYGSRSLTKPPRSRRPSNEEKKSGLGRASQKMGQSMGYLHLDHLQESDFSSDISGISQDHEELLRAARLANHSSNLACSSLFWRKVEPVFASIKKEDASNLIQELSELTCTERLDTENDANEATLFQIVSSALIFDDQVDENGDSDIASEPDTHTLVSADQRKHDIFASDAESSTQHEQLDINDRLFLEVQSLGISLQPDSDENEYEDIDQEIMQLDQSLNQQIEKKKRCLNKLYDFVQKSRALDERSFEEVALEKLVGLAYKKLLCTGDACDGAAKTSKRTALAFVKRTLSRCHQFEDLGSSCFNMPMFQDVTLLDDHIIAHSPSHNDACSSGSVPKPSSGINSVGRTERRKRGRPRKNDTSEKNCRLKASHLVTSVNEKVCTLSKTRINASGTSSTNVNVSKEIRNKGKETLNNEDLPLQDFDGTVESDTLLDFEDDGLGDNDYSAGLDVPADDLSTVDLTLPPF